MSEIFSIDVVNTGGKRSAVVRLRENVTHFFNLDELDENARLELLRVAIKRFAAEHADTMLRP